MEFLDSLIFVCPTPTQCHTHLSNLNIGRLIVHINSYSSIIQACALKEWHETSMSKAVDHGARGRLPLELYNSAQTPCLDTCKDLAPGHTLRN